jgi:RimJ/RimL family protein N-acetyltransferase
MLSELFRGNRLRLAALSRNDIPTLARWQRDAEFLRLFDSLPAVPRNEAALAQWLEDEQKASDNFIFATRLLDNDDLIGYIHLSGVAWSHGVCWIALAVGDRANWGKGYGYEMAQLGLAFAFRELNLHRVQATVFGYNERSIGLFEKLGFKREGVYREYLHRDGKRYDMYLYGILRHEWESRNAG